MRFFAKSPCPYGFGGNTFFIDLIFTFCGLERAIFQSVWRFSEIEGRPSILENYFTVDRWSSSIPLPQIFLMNCKTWFSKIEGRPSILENHPVAFTKVMGNAPLNSGKPPEARNFGRFWGVKPQKSQPNFFCGSGMHIKNTFCKKNGSKRSLEPSAVVNIIYIRLYGVATANQMIITEIQIAMTEIIWLGN